MTYQPSFVVNAAAFTGVDAAEADTTGVESVNVRGAASVAAATHRRGIPLIHISTDYVFDGEKGSPYSEDDPVSPINAYGRTKAEGEDAVRQAAERHVILRSAWLFGAYGSNFLKTILRLCAETDELHVVNDQYGSPAATVDLARAILRVTQADDIPWGTFHYGGNGAVSRHDFAVAVAEAQTSFTKKSVRVRPIRTVDRVGVAPRPKYAALDSSKFERIFSLPASDWRSGVARSVGELFGAQP